MVVGGAPHQDGDGVGIGAFSPHGRTPRSRQYGPAGPRPLPLAGFGSRSEGVLPSLPDLPTNFTQSASPSPLIPLPIIGVPFECIGMDLVGPLPKSARGHEHILVIVDYATRYPEAVPLRKATAKAIAQELFLLSSRVGIPAEVLTDQGTPFMSRLMADLCRLLRVKQLRTTVYHPQTDGLVERFNQTLKQMLRRVVAEDKHDWDLMLPYVLFWIREVPQASTGFTPSNSSLAGNPGGSWMWQRRLGSSSRQLIAQSSSMWNRWGKRSTG